MLNAGKFDRRIIVQLATVTTDTRGERTDTWANYASLWARVKSLGDNLDYDAESTMSVEKKLFAVRYSAKSKAIEPDNYRIVFDSKTYAVEGPVLDPEDMHVEIQIRAVRRD